jgi:ribosomal protein L7/L12
MRSSIAKIFRHSGLSLLVLFACVGCQPNARPVATPIPDSEPEHALETLPEPEPPSRVQGTSDREVIAFVESLIELKSAEDAFALIHPECLPALEGEEQRKVCNQKLENGIQSTAEDVFLVSAYDTSKTFWKPGEFETAVEPELVVTTRADWTEAYFPFQDGFTKWLLAKDGDQWRIVMPAVKELKLAREHRSYEAAVRESNMTDEEKVQSAAETAKTLPEDFKAELKLLIDAGNRLAAIKRCHEELGSGLTVARAIVESLQAEWAAAKEDPDTVKDESPLPETPTSDEEVPEADAGNSAKGEGSKP